ncbi:MAG: class adenine-specific methyltransferase [Ilumatobacteraceae bacterium]|nr:class adenine-specific methyltransferase [Ilumatobacteraceae bacterium]
MLERLLNEGDGKRLMLSPLRYPGGKGRLYPLLRAIVRANDLTAGTYVEPYAGGAGAAIALLITGQVQRVVVNDLDPAVHAFWRSVVDQPYDFARLVKDVPLTVKEWRKQKAHYADVDRTDYLRLGFATFFLNRTNRSGVLNGGPIGGLDQSGPYKIDARFNREGLLERLRLIALHADRVTVLGEDGRTVIEEYAQRKDSLIYADPPYFEKSGSLYMNSFSMANHEELAACLNAHAQGRWLLTYDDVPDVERLYPERRIERFGLSYSAHRVTKATETLVLSDGLLVPTV